MWLRGSLLLGVFPSERKFPRRLVASRSQVYRNPAMRLFGVKGKIRESGAGETVGISLLFVLEAPGKYAITFLGAAPSSVVGLWIFQAAPTGLRTRGAQIADLFSFPVVRPPAIPGLTAVSQCCRSTFSRLFFRWRRRRLFIMLFLAGESAYYPGDCTGAGRCRFAGGVLLLPAPGSPGWRFSCSPETVGSRGGCGR